MQLCKLNSAWRIKSVRFPQGDLNTPIRKRLMSGAEKWTMAKKDIGRKAEAQI
jgi:hypothetical protein